VGPARHGRSAATGALAVLLSLAWGQGGPLAAATVNVSPLQIFLSPRTKSAVLSLTNAGDRPLRFRLSVFAWEQSAQGEMRLAPTRDIVFFPQLLSLAPGERRTIRVGTTTPPAAVEKTYRLFVEELPPLDPSPLPSGEVRVVSRMGIPIFLEPTRPAIAGRIDNLALRAGKLAFEVRNTGTVHFVAQAVRVTAHGADGEPILQGELDGWYVLAGGIRAYELDLPRDTCPSVRAVSVEVATAKTVLRQRHEVLGTACPP
jgi:fimbrial chaperone protein